MPARRRTAQRLLRGPGPALGRPRELVVARDDAETAKLREIERRAAANGVPDVRWLDAAAIRELEPADHRPGRAAVADHGHR